ncbi:MAG: MlaD family protein [Prevotella sp.]|uniref:MlaD family protein n=1 Tax=Prevotella sp. PTAC TaxID=2736295 RepID=UPI001556CA7E|nr:MlaD family protein [Prevotella sp. PTAC]MCX4292501.1 MlaD family protein [Prevotella sp.]NPD53664.1 MCE family protein [Prevotella sp. PTAC]
MKFFNKEVQIALVAIAGIVVLFFGLQFLKGLSLYSNEDTYYVAFDDISGLSASSPVYAAGYKVGVVKDIIYNYNKTGEIIAVVGLDKNLRLPKGSTAEIESDMLGNIKVNLMLTGNPLEHLVVGDTIIGNKDAGMLGRAAAMIPTVEKMLPKLDSIMAGLNMLLYDKALLNSIHNVDQITSELMVTTRETNRLMAGLNRNVPGMMEKANKVLDNTDKLTEQLTAVDVASTMAKVDATLANVHDLTEKMNSDEGTFGLLMRDPELYNNLTATMRDADSLMIDLKQHPKRYVHFSVFGRKAK